MARSPGDIQDILTPSAELFRIYANGALQGTSSRILNTYQNYRPLYPRGSVIPVGGKRWIYPTPYRHRSRNVHCTAAESTQIGPGGIVWRATVETPNVELWHKTYNQSVFDLEGIPLNLAWQARIGAKNESGDSKAGLGEDIATYAQTVRMFRNKGTLLKNILTAFKDDKAMKRFLNASYNQIKRIDKGAASAFLEYQYGWKPLMQDIYGVVELLKQHSSGAVPIIIHGKGKAYEKNVVEKTVWSSSTNGADSYGKIKGVTETKVYVDLYSRLDPEAQVFRVLNQLGLLNPASLAWELTPWSFVVDWFVPTGPFLQSLSATVGLKFISGTECCKSTTVSTGDFTPKVGGVTGIVLNSKACNFTVIDESYYRRTFTDWPFAWLYMDQNPFKGDRSFKALALAITNLKLVRNGIR